MKTRLPSSLVLLGLLACSQPHPAAETSAPATLAAAPPAAPVAVPAPTIPEASPRLSARQLYGTFAAAADTALSWQGHSYHLRWRVRLDTLRPLTHITPPDPSKGFKGDTSQGFQGYYQMEVRDSLGHQVGQHTFTKPDFYPAVGPALAISSYVELPRLLGYSEPLGGLVFTVAFNAPETDWYGEAVLVLAPSGQVRYLADGRTDSGPDLTTTLSGDGRTLLAASAIQYAGRPPLPLLRAGAELRGAMLLNDTLALIIYEPGQSRIQPNGMPYLEASPAQQRQPNAFVRDVRDGREVARFRYDGFYAELGYVVPMFTVPQAHAAYLLDAAKGLYVLPLRQPATGRLLSFASLPHATGQLAAGEVSAEIGGPMHYYRFLIDTANAAHVRYQLLKE